MSGQSTKKAVGIDLGTTFSVVSHLNEFGHPHTLPNAEGDLTTPSVVLFDRGDVIVGKEAAKAIAREADHVADSAKRDMGREFYHKALDGQQYPPEVIQAYVLKKVHDDAAMQIGDFHEAVITVPAYFDEVRRKATQDAAYMAGLTVLDIINEPTAAALAYGIRSGFLSPGGKSSKPQTILVYDLGGGTFDVTLMVIDGSHFTALATDGDVRLGGQDWDQRLVDLVAQEFLDAHGLDPRSDANTAGILMRECEDAKRTLSARQEAIVGCEFQGCQLPVTITRDQFEEITADLLERTQFTTVEVLKTAGMDWGRIDRILAMGGSTRMPMVRNMLEQLSGKPIDRSVSPDESVSHGAALHAGLLLATRTGREPPFSIQNVNSHSLGVVAVDAKTGDGRTAILIERNTPIPAKVKRIFRTQRPNQRSILVQIVEGESPAPEHCTPIGRCAVKDLPAHLPARSPIEVTFAYAANGRLAIKVTVPGTDSQVVHEIHRASGLTQQELEAWRAKIANGG